MTIRHDKPKRWHPRFSVRTLVVVVTLVCVYLALWEQTKKHGPGDVQTSIIGENPSLWKAVEGLTISYHSPLPLIVAADFATYGKRRYYFCFFGYVAKLPFEWEIDPTSIPYDELPRTDDVNWPQKLIEFF